jgi:hypothetical protein
VNRAARAKGRKEPEIVPKSISEGVMAKTVSMIGIDPGELVWVRTLLFLLRHPDPLIAEMVKQALLYLERNGCRNDEAGATPNDQAR